MGERGRDFAAIVQSYCDDVMSGQLDVGKHVRLAVKRHLDDLASPPPGFLFDEGAAVKSLALAERLAVPKGAKRGKRFRLMPWQCFLLWVFFGWRDDTGLSRWRSVYIELPKGQSKSPLAALIGLIALARGRSTGAKVACAATTEKQANNVFEPAQESLRLSPEVMSAAGLVVGQHAIRGIGDNRVFERVSAEKRSADGRVDDVVIVDEIHQHPDRALYDTLAQNASKVPGACIVVITTAGTDQSPTAIGWVLHCEARDVLDGRQDNPALFAFISAADRKRDPWDEATWRQANPAYGEIVSAPGFRAAAASAKADPGAQPHFFATRLGWWAQAAGKWMDLNRWDAAARPLTDGDLQGKAVFLGVDYAPKLDLTAIVAVGLSIREDGKRQYFVRSQAYLPEGSPTLTDIPELAGWAEEGWLTLTPGEVLDAGYLRVPIGAKVRQYAGAEVCLDPFGCVELMASLPRDGITPVEVTQTWKHHSPAMTEVQVALGQDRLFHDGSPVMRLCMANVVAKVDRNGNTVPTRESDAKKIDLTVALLNAMVRASVAVPVITTPEIFFVGDDD